jgi:hypothetical protein
VTQAMCTSFKVELFTATHNFAASGGHTFKMALYTSAATLDATTTAYSATNEASGTNYVAGGTTLTNSNPSSSGTTAMCSFAANPTWTSATFNASQALIYNSSVGNKAVAVLDFGSTQTVVAGDFVVTLPAVTSTTALLRLV